MMEYATLDKHHNIIPTQEFALDYNRTVAKTSIEKYNISTVFLGINHNFGTGKDQWFETLCSDDTMLRYETWQKALDGHIKIVNARIIYEIITNEKFSKPNFDVENYAMEILVSIKHNTMIELMEAFYNLMNIAMGK